MIKFLALSIACIILIQADSALAWTRSWETGAPTFNKDDSRPSQNYENLESRIENLEEEIKNPDNSNYDSDLRKLENEIEELKSKVEDLESRLEQ